MPIKALKLCLIDKYKFEIHKQKQLAIIAMSKVDKKYKNEFNVYYALNSNKYSKKQNDSKSIMTNIKEQLERAKKAVKKNGS